jgi:hypothetical protein
VTFTVDIPYHVLADFFWAARVRRVRASQSLARPQRPLARTARHAYRLHCHTTKAIAQLHYSSTFARTPDVKYIFAHAGKYRALPGRAVRHPRRGARHPRSRGPCDRDLAVSCREHIEATPELTDGERTAVLGATATTLIPRLATLRPRTRTRAL